VEPEYDRAMAIARRAKVVVSRGGVDRPGVMLEEVAPHIIKGINPGEEEKTRQYRVQMPAYSGYPEWTDVFSEYELKAVPHDSRFS
jgi:hypothetical protein